MSPREVLAKHTSRELSEWQAFYKLEAIDQQQAADKAKLRNDLGRRRGRRR